MSDARLTAKLTLEAELARPLARVLMGYVARWEHLGGVLTLADRIGYQMSIRAALERHYARTVSVMLGKRPTSATTIDSVALSMRHGERLRARAHNQALYILGSIDRDLVAIMAAGADADPMAIKSIDGFEAKKDPPSSTGSIGYSLRLRATAMQAFYKLRAKLRAMVNAETEETAEEAMFEWVSQGKANAPVVKAWITVGDERVRDSHVAAGETYGLEGTPIPVDQAFQLAGGQLRFPGDSSLGAPLRELINCFPAGTAVSGNVTAATRHWYEGDLIEITTSSGHNLSGTPNHPILTPKGWVALGSLMEGDDVICRLSGIRHDNSLSGPAEKPERQNVQDVEPAIEEIFDSLYRSQLSVRHLHLTVNFHGDQPTQDVDIVRADGGLRLGLDGAGSQQFNEFALALPLVHEGFGSRDGLAREFHVGDRHIAPGLVGAGCENFPFAFSHLGKADVVGFGSGSALNACVLKGESYGAAADAHLLGDGENRIAGLVKADDLDDAGFPRLLRSHHPGFTVGAGDAGDLSIVPHTHGADPARLGGFADAHPTSVKVDRVTNCVIRQAFAGHVYNLETTHGMYYANGVVASNCRCSLAYYAVTPDGLVPLGLTTPSLPTRKPWRPGDRFGSEIPVRATESVTLNGRTRARVVLGDDRTFATLTQTSPTTINVTVDGHVVARATHANGQVTQFVVAPGRDGLGIERLVRESVVRSHRRRVAP